MNPDSAIVRSRVVVPGSVAERALVHRTTVGLPVPENGSGRDQSHILVSIALLPAGKICFAYDMTGPGPLRAL